MTQNRGFVVVMAGYRGVEAVCVLVAFILPLELVFRS